MAPQVRVTLGPVFAVADWTSTLSFAIQRACKTQFPTPPTPLDRCHTQPIQHFHHEGDRTPPFDTLRWQCSGWWSQAFPQPRRHGVQRTCIVLFDVSRRVCVALPLLLWHGDLAGGDGLVRVLLHLAAVNALRTAYSIHIAPVNTGCMVLDTVFWCQYRLHPLTRFSVGTGPLHR